MGWIAAVKDWLPLVTIASPMFILIGAVIAGFSFQRSRHLAHFQKSVDVVMHLNLRYDSFLKDLHSVETIGERQAEGLFSRFWCLQSDQFDAFIVGLVDPLTFSTWNVHLIRSFRDSKKIGSATFSDGWKATGKRNTAEAPFFVWFVDRLLEKSLDNSENMTDKDFCIERQRQIYNHPPVVRFRRHLTRRELDSWDWELDLFKRKAPSLDLTEGVKSGPLERWFARW